jgi:hypothetical protein
MSRIWIPILGPILGVVVGWGFAELSRYINSKREYRERRISIYQQAFAQVVGLEASLSQVHSWNQIKPIFNNFRHWYYNNNLSLNSRTGDVLNDLMIVIAFQCPLQLSQRQGLQPINMLLVPAIQEALNKAKVAIKAVTGHKTDGITPQNQQDNEQQKNITLQIPTFAIVSFLLMYVYLLSFTQTLSLSSWIPNRAYLIFSILALAFVIFLCVIVYLPSKNVVKIIKFSRTIWWWFIYWPCVVLGYAWSFIQILATIATKEAENHINIAWFYVFFIVGFIALFSVAFYPVSRNWQQKRRNTKAK